MEYIRFSEDYSKNILIPAVELPFKYIKNVNKPYFISMMKYSDKQYKEWLKTKTLAKMSGSLTDRIWADFDSANVRDAFEDAKVFYTRLCSYGLDDKNIQIAFSGNKGVAFIIDLEDQLSLEEVKKLVFTLADGLKTFDTSMYDNQRIFRLLFTKHEKSGLFKIPLTSDELLQYNLDNVVENAKSLDNFNKEEILSYYNRFKLTDKLNSIKNEVKKEVAPVKTKVKAEKKEVEIDLTEKPTHWKTYKWSLVQGNFPTGERHNALMVIAATCRGLGYDKETTYYICKSALKKQAEKSGSEEFDKEELWENIIEKSVFSDNWEGGQYSPKTNPWLAQYCEKMGFAIEEQKDTVIGISDTYNLFESYAENIDNLTIKTGIPALDAKLRMTIGMSVGIVAAPGSGKTSIAIQMLNNMSKAGHRCLFFSYDMFHALVYQKLIQKHSGLNDEQIYELYKSGDTKRINEIKDKIAQEYSKVDFCFQAGQNVDDIIRSIKEAEDKSGEKVKFVVMDYNELVLSDYSDPTASSSFIAQKMRQIANELQVCVLSLYQPNKMTGTPADEIKSYRATKGSSGIEQSVSIMLGISRPGYDPRNENDDRFLTINCLKNRMGKLFSLDLHWDGLQGAVREMTEEEEDHLRRVEERKKLQDEGNKKAWE